MSQETSKGVVEFTDNEVGNVVNSDVVEFKEEEVGNVPANPSIAAQKAKEAGAEVIKAAKLDMPEYSDPDMQRDVEEALAKLDSASASAAYNNLMRHLLEQMEVPDDTSKPVKGEETGPTTLGAMREDRYKKLRFGSTEALQQLMGGEEGLHRLLATVNVLSNPEKWGDRFVKRLAQNLVPQVSNHLNGKPVNQAEIAAIMANPTQKAAESDSEILAQN